MNLNNANPQNVDALLKILGGKLNMSPDKLRKEAEAGRFDSALKNMKPDEAAKFNAIMNNPKLMESFMSAPQAQALYKKLTGGK